MDILRNKLVRLAHARPDLRPHLLPLLAEGGTKTAAMDLVAGKDTLEFVTWALKTQHPVPMERVIGFLERNGVEQAADAGPSRRGQPIGEGEYVEIQANNAPGDLQDILQPYHLQRGQVIKTDGADIVIQFDGTGVTLRVPGGTASGKASGVYRSSAVEDVSGKKLFEVVYLPANERKPTQVSVEVLRAYVERGLSGGEERSENYFTGYVPSWKVSKEGNPYFMMWTQQRGGRPRTVSPAKGKVYYIGLVGRRPASWKSDLSGLMQGEGMPLVASTRRTAGKVSVRFDNGLTVEDIEGMSSFGRIGQVAHLNTSRSGARPTRAAIEFARSNATTLNAMTSGDQAIAAIQAHVYKVTGKSLAWQYIQLPM